MANGIEPGLRKRIIENGQAAFASTWTPENWVMAPGRLELLGNHVDYNGGLVLAGAIDRVVAIGVAQYASRRGLAFVAGDVSPAPFEIDPSIARDWRGDGASTGPREYALGILAALTERAIQVLDGAELSIAGNVPLGFGMSSSAGLCVALTLALARAELSQADIVAVAQEAEHRAGSPVGAMDQSASVAGGVILFDGSDTSFRRLEPDLGLHVFAVADSGVHHAIGTSSYPERVRESQLALSLIQEHAIADLKSLGELMPDQWLAIHEKGILNDVLTRRVEHVVSEVERVRQGVDAVEGADWKRFGSLMTASGRSSATSYDISHPRVEELVADLVATPGVCGARMMGGGEGGPALALLHRDVIDDVADALERGYFARYPSSPVRDRFQVCVFGEGARKLQAHPRTI
jgi:galactokinase